MADSAVAGPGRSGTLAQLPIPVVVLSAWEAERSGLPNWLTCGAGCPRVTARDRSPPGLMAR